MTVLFADLSGYTALAESLDPEEVHAFIRPAMTKLRLVVQEFGGTVPQVMGDGFMAVFGVPSGHEDDAERAVRSALALRDEVERLNSEAPAGAVHIPALHSGVNSGEVLVAPSREAGGFSVTGDTVNTAARLAGLARSGEVLVGAPVHALTRHTIEYGPRRSRKVKGKEEEVTVYEALAASTSAPAGRPRRDGSVIFVDRTEAIARLGQEVAHVRRTKRSRVLVIEGDPGIGKSRLSGEFSRRVGARVTWLPGRCPPYGQHLPIFAIADAVRIQLGLKPGAIPGRGAEEAERALELRARELTRGGVERFLRQVSLLLGRDDRATPRAIGRSQTVEPAARSVIEALARRKTVVVQIDDLQWADPDLIDLLEEAAADPWNGPILFLGLTRREPAPTVRGSLTMHLDSIPARKMRTMADLILGSRLPERVAERLVQRADGNPLYLEEGARMLAETGGLRAVAGRWELTDQGALDSIPDTLRALITARLDALGPDARDLLANLAVCGDSAPATLVKRLTGRPITAIARDLVARDLFLPVEGSELAFKHRLIRDVAYESLPRAERAAKHRIVADWLRSRRESRADAAALAHHFEQAWLLSRSRTGPDSDPEVPGLAASYLNRWGAVAFAFQPRQAEEIFVRAAAAAQAAGNTAALSEASVGRAECLVELARHPEADLEAGHALELAETIGRQDLRARALLTLGRSNSDIANIDLARRQLDEALTMFEAAKDTQGRAWTLQRMSEAVRFEGIAPQVDLLRRSLALFVRSRDVFGRMTVLLDLAYLLSIVGGEEFDEHIRQAREIAEEQGDERSRANLLRTSAYNSYYSRMFRAAIRDARAAQPLAHEAGDRWVEADSLLIEALAGGVALPPEEAEQLSRKVISIADRAGARHLRAMGVLASARPALRAGRPDLAKRRLTQARKILIEVGAEAETAEVDLIEAEVFLAVGDPRAAGSASRAEEAARAGGWTLLEVWAAELHARALRGLQT